MEVQGAEPMAHRCRTDEIHLLEGDVVACPAEDAVADTQVNEASAEDAEAEEEKADR